MRFSRLMGLGLATFALGAVVATSHACDGKNSQTSGAATATGTTATIAVAGAHGACTASMASTCTASQAAACPHAATAQAVTVSAGGTCAHSATSASAGGCASKGAAAAGGMAASCSDPSKTSKGARSASAQVAQHDCDYCASMVACNDELKALGANIQVIMLKNGVAFLYTAGTSNGTNAVQAAMARRNERDEAIARSGAKAHVCDECRAMRQAMTEGKINREVVRIEGGSMAIMTSTDPTIVAKFHRWAAEAKAEHDGRAKS